MRRPRQIGMFDRTIVRLELWFERNPQEPGGAPIPQRRLAGMFHKRAIALRRSRGRKGHPGRSRKDLAAVCDVELTVRALSTFKDGQSATPECFSETGSGLQPC